MKMSNVLLGVALAVPFAISTFAGCRGPVSSELKEVAEDQIAEAVVNQAISSYYSASVSISGEYSTLNLTCSKGGSLTWGEYVDGDGSICYETASNGCNMSGADYGSLTLNGSYDVCGFPTSYDDEAAKFEDLDGKTLYIGGSVEVSGENIQTRSCDYDLEITAIQITGSGDSLTFASGVNGYICNSRNFDASIEFAVSGSIDAEESDQTE